MVLRESPMGGLQVYKCALKPRTKHAPPHPHPTHTLLPDHSELFHQAAYNHFLPCAFLGVPPNKRTALPSKGEFPGSHLCSRFEHLFKDFKFNAACQQPWDKDSVMWLSFPASNNPSNYIFILQS